MIIIIIIVTTKNIHMCFDCHILFIRITKTVVFSGRTFCVDGASTLLNRVRKKLTSVWKRNFHIYCKCFLENIFSLTCAVKRKELKKVLLRRIFRTKLSSCTKILKSFISRNCFSVHEHHLTVAYF